MKYLMLKEGIYLVKQVLSQQSNTGGCAIECLDQVIRNLCAINCNEFSEQEVATMILQEFEALFLEFPEIKGLFHHLAGL